MTENCQDCGGYGNEYGQPEVFCLRCGGSGKEPHIPYDAWTESVRRGAENMRQRQEKDQPSEVAEGDMQESE